MVAVVAVANQLSQTTVAVAVVALAVARISCCHLFCFLAVVAETIVDADVVAITMNVTSKKIN